MPNIVTNILNFGSGSQAKEAFCHMLQAVRKDGEAPGSITFEKLIPMPEYVRASMEPGEESGNQPPLWYTWSLENWGSKWDAIDYCPLDPEQGDNTMIFSTALSPVESVVTALSRMFPEQIINYRWAENENPGMNVGEMTLRNGVKLSERIPDDLSRDALELSAAILNFDPADDGPELLEDSPACEERERPPVPSCPPHTERRTGRRNHTR